MLGLQTITLQYVVMVVVFYKWVRPWSESEVVTFTFDSQSIGG